MDHNIIGFTAVLCMFGGPLIVGAVWIACNAWSKVATHQREIELKHRLLDAGMTADEIERVMNAGQASIESRATSEPAREMQEVA